MGLISRRVSLARERLARENQGDIGFWDYIMPRINKGVVIPVISNAFRIEQIFRETSEETNRSDSPLSIYEELTQVWADIIGYPAADKLNLARVARYFLIEQKEDAGISKVKFVRFLSDILLSFAGKDMDYHDLALEYQSRSETPFSELVHALDYPRFTKEKEDPLRLLARLPLPIYITTSYFDFMERALEQEGRKPVIQICHWSGKISGAKPEHRIDPELIPSIENPVVYHLYGLEDYPQTLVLSEDDYLSFLIAMTKDKNTVDPIVPLWFRRAIGESNLLLLGYRVKDWDFRILFRFFLRYQRDEFSPRGIIVQAKENQVYINDYDRATEYLAKYFDRRKFDFQWEITEDIIYKLWDQWNQYRQGQT